MAAATVVAHPPHVGGGPGGGPGPGQPETALPIYDLFLDLPHPAASKACPPPFVLGSPSTSPEMEKELNANLSRIGRFAFPEFDDATAQEIPRDMQMNRFSQYAMQPKTFQHYAFSLQLQSGVRIHGHVRRYLPIHPLVKTRYDIGRRGERALVLLTRANGGDLVYSAVLKTMDAIISQKSSLEKQLQPHNNASEKWFLYKLSDQHRHLCNTFASLPQQERKPMVLTVDSLEVGTKPIPLIDQVDNSKFLIPASLLAATSSTIESVSSSSILPLLRVLGVQNTLRLFSAMISESRILLVSNSPTRLAQCARSALSVLAQGLLNWQHLYIPVLPPHLFQYLAAPVPYLIGMLATMMPRLEQARSDGLGEIVIINLDTAQMETRGINPADIATKIPDLFRSTMAEQGMPSTSMSAPEMLAQDLVDLLKVDKRSLYGESTLSNVSETAAKATKAVKVGFLKLKEKGKQFLRNRASSTVSAGSDDDIDVSGGGGNVGGDNGETGVEDTMLPDFIYTQGAQNEASEEEACIAFASFFLSMFGNMRWYLSAAPGQLPQLDRQRFMQQKRAMGEGESTPIWPLLVNFCQTQMLEEFAKARVEEVRNRLPVSSDSPLFAQCSNYHRMHNIDFSVVNVRRVARQVAQNNPSRIILQTQARRTTMLLTSNRTYEGDYNRAVAALVEECRECSSLLFDVMSVIWVRLRDSKGLHWKHGFQALQILRNLLYHGPLSAIAEATDGLSKIRVMKFYNDNMRSQICTQMRQVANQVYNLLVDRAKLFAIRRLCINKRRLLRKQDQTRLVKDSRMRTTTPFNAMHKAYNPRSTRVVPHVNAPTSVAKTQFAAEQDLLDFSGPAAAQPQPQAGLAPTSNSTAQDLVGLFTTNVTVSEPAATVAGNPFGTPTATMAAPTTPAAARVPPVAIQTQQQQYQPQATPTQQYPPQHQEFYGGVAMPGQQPPVAQGYAHVAAPQPVQSPAQQPYQQQQQGYPAAPQAQQIQYAAHPPPAQQHGAVPGYPPQQYQQQQQAPTQQSYYQQQGGLQHAPPQYQQQQQVAFPPAHPQQGQVPPPQHQQKPDMSQFDPFK